MTAHLTGRAGQRRDENAVLRPFGAESLMWELMGDIRFLLVFPAALIMQVMHPAIGAAVGDFSVYRTDPWGRAVRSLDSVLLWVYGGPGAIEEGRRLRELHKPITGTDDAGRRYHALSPEVYTWVHATTFERLRTQCALFGTPLSDEQEEQLYQEFLRLGRILGIRDRDMPADRKRYWRYFDDMLDTVLENHPTPREVLSIMNAAPPAPPILPAWLRALWSPVGTVGGEFGHFLTVATLPPKARDILEVSWTAADERKFLGFASAVRGVVPKLPERLRYMPFAYRARALEHARERIRRRALKSVV